MQICIAMEWPERVEMLLIARRINSPLHINTPRREGGTLDLRRRGCSLLGRGVSCERILAAIRRK